MSAYLKLSQNTTDLHMQTHTWSLAFFGYCFLDHVGIFSQTASPHLKDIDRDIPEVEEEEEWEGTVALDDIMKNVLVINHQKLTLRVVGIEGTTKFGYHFLAFADLSFPRKKCPRKKPEQQLLRVFWIYITWRLKHAWKQFLACSLFL